MLNPFSKFISILGLTAISTISVNQVNAQDFNRQLIAQTPVTFNVIRPSSPLDLSDLMNKAFNQNTGDFFEQATIGGTLNFIFGWRRFPQGSYSENSIDRDSALMNAIIYDYFDQLSEREPTIRTRDLTNPFSESLKQNPSFISE